MPDYQFVVSEGLPQPATRAIRSHAMKTALHKKASQGATRPQHESVQLGDAPQMEKCKDSVNLKFRLVSRSKEQKHQERSRTQIGQDNSLRDLTTSCLGQVETTQASISTSNQPQGAAIVVRFPIQQSGLSGPGGGYLDPFQSFCIPYSPQVDSLVKYCKLQTRCVRLHEYAD